MWPFSRSRASSQSKPDPLSTAFEEFRPALVATAIYSIACNVLLFVGPIYMMQIYDRVLSSRSVTTLIFLSMIAVFLLLAYAMLDWVRSRLLVRAGVRFDARLNQSLFRAALDRALAVRSTAPGAALRDMDTVREYWTGSGVLTLFDAPFAPIFVLICFLMHPWLGVVALIGALVLLALAIANEYLTREALADAGRNGAEAGHYVQTSLRNVEAIQALGMQGAIHDRWSRRHKDALAWQASASDRAGAVMAATKFVRQVLQVAILGVGAYLAIGREITPGAMIAASIMMGRALQPVEQAVGQWKQLVSARQAWRRLVDLFAVAKVAEERTALPPPKGRLDIEAVTAATADRVPILRNVSFSVEAGETLAVIGPSGAGKSTLARVLTGTWPLASGAVRLDGASLDHWDRERLGQHLGYLPQDVELFAGTVAENIARFQQADAAEVIAAAELAGVHDIIQRLPNGYDTQIGEAGNILSGGQRQRIALARALFGKPAVLVLDEPNSHLDSGGEENLLQALRRIKERGVTIVVITHRPTLLASADQVLVLSEGVVKLFGPPRTVLQQVAGNKVSAVPETPAASAPAATNVAAGKAAAGKAAVAKAPAQAAKPPAAKMPPGQPEPVEVTAEVSSSAAAVTTRANGTKRPVAAA